MHDEEADIERQKKVRKLPIMVDGELVALDEEVRQKINDANEKRKIEIKEEEEERVVNEDRPVSLAEKNDIIRKNLFSGRRKGLFGDAVRGFM